MRRLQGLFDMRRCVACIHLPGTSHPAKTADLFPSSTRTWAGECSFYAGNWFCVVREEKCK